MRIKNVAGVLLAVALAACGNGEKQNANSELIFHGDTVTVDAGSPICSKIKMITLAEEPFSNEFRTVGTAQAETGRYAEVCTPFDGRVTRSAVRLGDKVRAGQVLFEMSSADFVEASKTYFQAVRQNEQAQAEYKRKQTLFEHGIAAKRELDEAMTEAENARKEMESAEATLKVYNMNASTLKMGQSLRICAPIDGEVVASSITPGQFVKADDEPLVTIADLSKVWVTALIKERYIGIVNAGGEAEIFTDAQPDKVIIGKVFNVGNLVDEETRSVQVVLACDNPDRMLKHGMYVSVHFMSEPKPSIVVPSTAVFQGENRSYVFVATGKANTYVRREVETGNSSDDNSKVSIRKGLKVGDQVIAVGGLYLND